MMKDSIWNHNPAKFIKECKRLRALCERILHGDESIIEGCHKMLQYQFWMKEEENDSWMIFRVVDSQSGHLPVGRERAHWNLQALQEKDEEIAVIEDKYRDSVWIAASAIREQYERYLGQSAESNPAALRASS